MNIRIVEATPNDVKTLANLKLDIWRHVYDKILPEEYLNNLSVQNKEKKYHNEINSTSYDIYIIKNSMQIVGTIRIHYYFMQEHIPCASIEDLYLFPQFHSKGYGGSALLFAVKKARKHHCHFLTAWIIENNIVVRKMAMKFGFKETCKKRIHAQTGTLLILYEYSLNQ